MNRRRRKHLISKVQVRAGQRVCGTLADRVGRAGRQPHPEQVTSDLGDPAPRNTIRRGQRHQRRLQSRSERTAGDLRRQAGAGPRAALTAAQPVRAMLAEHHTDRRQLGDLIATEPATRPTLRRIERPPAPATRPRVVIDDLIHLILGPQFATGATVPRPSTLLTALSIPAQKLLRLRPRLRPPPRARLRRIHRRRPGTRPRVLTRLSLQPGQPLLELLHPSSKINNELHAYLTPRVIDRLRLGTVHNRKIRCTKQETLPQAPTTERLLKPVSVQVFLEPAGGLEPPTPSLQVKCSTS